MSDLKMMERIKNLPNLEPDYLSFMNNYLSNDPLFIEEHETIVFCGNDFLGDYDYTKYQEEE